MPASEEITRSSETPIQPIPPQGLGHIAVARESILTSNETTRIPDGIVTGEDFVKWGKEAGYGNGRRGTYHNEDSYLYVKSCHEVQAEEDVGVALEAVRYLTSKGVLHPDTQWGVFKRETEYQLFAVSPKLEAFMLDDHLGTEHETRLGKPYGVEGSHIHEWCRRVDPDFDPNKDVDKDSLLRLLNLFEASHTDNWGWDENGTLYPVDVEVIDISTGLDVAKRWHESRQAPLVSVQ